MGAEQFIQKAKGKTAQEAFNKAREQAYWDYGHAGYTGSIAEKDDFVMIPLPEGVDPDAHMNSLMVACDERIDDKWGPAGCIDLGNEEFLFFGWASS